MGKKKPSSVNATPEVAGFVSSLQKGSYLDKLMNDATALLSENLFAGENIEKNRIPNYYKEKYGLHNLYVLNLNSSRRLTYTLISDSRGISVNIIEIFLNHKKYEKRFGYG